MRLEGARVAVTGASSGIGEAAALAFAKHRCRLALAARRREALEEVAKRAREAGAAEARVRAVDVTRRGELEAWGGELREAWGGLEVAVASAGVGHYGPFLASLPEHQEHVLATNVLGVWRTVQALAPLLEAARGHVVVLGSVAGRVPLPYLSTYCATKAALLQWSRAARPELARHGITLTLLAPGAVRTGFARHALRAPGIKGKDIGVAGGHGHTPEQVSRALLRCVARRRREVSLTLEGRLGQAFAVLAPHALARALEPGMRPRREGGGLGNWRR